MRDNTQELDVIFDKMGYTKNTDFRKEAIRLITDWHVKQMLAELGDSLQNDNLDDAAYADIEHRMISILTR